MGSHIVGHDWSDFASAAAAAAAAAACLGYYRFCYYEHKGAWIFSRYSFFSRDMLRTGIVGLYGNSVFTYFEELLYCFPSDCTSLHSTNSVRGIPSSPHPLQHLLFIKCLVTAILIGMRWYLLAVLICLYLLISNAEHLFICLLAICVSSFKPQISVVRVTSMDFV